MDGSTTARYVNEGVLSSNQTLDYASGQNVSVAGGSEVTFIGTSSTARYVGSCTLASHQSLRYADYGSSTYGSAVFKASTKIEFVNRFVAEGILAGNQSIYYGYFGSTIGRLSVTLKDSTSTIFSDSYVEKGVLASDQDVTYRYQSGNPGSYETVKLKTGTIVCFDPSHYVNQGFLASAPTTQTLRYASGGLTAAFKANSMVYFDPSTHYVILGTLGASASINDTNTGTAVTLEAGWRVEFQSSGSGGAGTTGWLAVAVVDSDGDGWPDDIDPNPGLSDPNPNQHGTPADLPTGVLYTKATTSGKGTVVAGEPATLTIPKGSGSWIAVLAVQTDEFPTWTGNNSEYNDTVSWSILRSTLPIDTAPLVGHLDVNSLHGTLNQAFIDGTSFFGFSPTYVRVLGTIESHPNYDRTVLTSLSVANIADGMLPTTAFVALVPMQLNAYRPEMVQNSVDLRPNDASKSIIPDDEELNPGVRIRLNRDDDDSDSPYKADAEEDSVIGENDLLKVTLSCEALSKVNGAKVLLKRNNSKIRVWEESTKGVAILKDDDEKEFSLDAQGKKVVWVEAIDQGAGELEWLITIRGSAPTSIGRIKFVTYENIVIGMSGETFAEWPLFAQDPKNNGMFNICQKLYLEGHNVVYYDSYYTNSTSGDPAYREASIQIQNCHVDHVALVGHSHGGGDVYIISNLLNTARATLEAFTINFTGYVDAIKHDFITNADPEVRYPPSSLYHWNYYQRQSRLDNLWLRGDSVTGSAVNQNVNNTAWGANLTHTTIDSDLTVQKDLHSAIRTHVSP
jgi:hypothetical protein